VVGAAVLVGAGADFFGLETGWGIDAGALVEDHAAEKSRPELAAWREKKGKGGKVREAVCGVVPPSRHCHART